MKRTMFVRAAGLSAIALSGAPRAGDAAAPAPSVDGLADGRADLVYARRVAAAAAERTAFTASVDNGDEARYAACDYVGSYAKMLPHDARGRVVRSAYQRYRSALASGSLAQLDVFGFPPRMRQLLHAAFDDAAALAGCDGRGLRVAPAPRLDSARTAHETIELYWQALTRDVPFSAYDSDPMIAQACAELTRVNPDATAAAVTPVTIFRGAHGAPAGPYLSQFVWSEIPCDMFGTLAQRHDLPVSGSDFLIKRDAWLAVQNGKSPARAVVREGRPRYLATGRDLADYVMRSDVAGVWRYTAAIVDGLGPQAVTDDFDLAEIACLTGLAGDAAFAGVAFQKFAVHRRVRPEELGGLLDRDRTGAPIDDRLRHAMVLDVTQAKTGTLLLPQAYARGCPAHPSYPAGHATGAGAGATILKAFVKPAFVFPAPVTASADGLRLEPYTQSPLTLGGEIDKFAANYAYGRDTAGVHYRSDSLAGLQLGEAAAIGVLRDYAALQGRGFAGFAFTSFDGSAIVIR